MAQGPYADQNSNFNPEEWMELTKQIIDHLKKLDEGFMIEEKKCLEKLHPEILWSDYEKKIEEDRKNFPKPERKFLNDECQKMFEEMLRLKQETAAGLARSSKILKK